MKAVKEMRTMLKEYCGYQKNLHEYGILLHAC